MKRKLPTVAPPAQGISDKVGHGGIFRRTALTDWNQRRGPSQTLQIVICQELSPWQTASLWRMSQVWRRSARLHNVACSLSPVRGLLRALSSGIVVYVCVYRGEVALLTARALLTQGMTTTTMRSRICGAATPSSGERGTVPMVDLSRLHLYCLTDIANFFAWCAVSSSFCSAFLCRDLACSQRRTSSSLLET